MEVEYSFRADRVSYQFLPDLAEASVNLCTLASFYYFLLYSIVGFLSVLRYTKNPSQVFRYDSHTYVAHFLPNNMCSVQY